MKIKSTSTLLLLVFSFFSVAIFAQSTAIIGTGTTTNISSSYPAPYGNYYWGAKHQIIIRASEMTAAGMIAGNITALAFQTSVPGGTSLTGFTIRMKATAATTVTNSFDLTGLTAVYGPQTYTDAAGWNTHTFATPFAWNGTSNILIETCFNNASYTQNSQMYYTTTSYNSVLHYRSDQTTVCNQSNGTTSLRRPNIKFSYIPNGPPTAQFTASPTSTCSGTVSFTDQSFYGITSRLWNFGDGSTSTAANPSHTYTASGTYSVSLTATNANGSNTLTKPNYITVTLGSGPIAPSCTPPTTAYCCGFGITNFTFHNINNTSGDGSEGYSDFSCQVDTVTTGQSYNISVSTLTPSTHNVRAWIDFNNDGTFNPTGELVFSADNSFTATGIVFIPGTATLSTPLRMRVSADHSLQAIPTPCSSPQFGQVEDYAIYVQPNTNPPVAQFTADDTLSCSGSIQFTDQSQNVPISWQWNFGDGGTSIAQHPIHTYTASGIYSVSLTVTNGNGSNTITKTSYIDVTLGNTPIAASCAPSTFSYCCGYGIYKVQLGTINKSSQDGAEGYQDYSCTDQTTLAEGQSYALSVQTNPSNGQDTKVWIDFNNDGTFTQANEQVFSSTNTIDPTGNISIPTGVATLNTLLRMRISSDGAGNNPGSCSALLQGQAEDYGVIIQQFVGVEEVISTAQVAAYPNPFSESTLLRITNEKLITNYELMVYDVYGKKVFVDAVLNSEGFLIHKGNLLQGIYIYEVTAKNGVAGKGKLVVQ